MADIGGEGSATFAAKATSAVGGGLVWGIFVTMLLVIPTLFAGIFSPFVSKANKVIKDKVEGIPTGAKPKTGKMTKADRLYQARMAELEAEREEQELANKLAQIKARKARAKSQGQNTSATVI